MVEKMTTKNTITPTRVREMMEKSILSYPYMTARSENSTPFETIKLENSSIDDFSEKLTEQYLDKIEAKYQCALLDGSAKEKLVNRPNCPAEYLLTDAEYDDYCTLYYMRVAKKSKFGEEERAEFNRLTNKVYKNAIDWFKNDPEGIELANKVALLC